MLNGIHNTRHLSSHIRLFLTEPWYVELYINEDNILLIFMAIY
jgi:hypothetical protein